MHIPDNFLSPPVWASLDVIALPAFGLAARAARSTLEEGRVPLLGVMGAFIFAAQMINFPVGIGTSGHLVGGALLAFTVGPACAAVVMTAILAVQAFVFQDGGILALGANVCNMALAGVLAGYLPYYLFGRGRFRRSSMFAGAFLSVLVSAGMALTELFMSGVRMPRSMLILSIALFVVSAAIEGAITVAVMRVIEKLNPGWVREPALSNRRTVAVFASAAACLAGAGFLLASTAPDGLQSLGQQLGIHASALLHAPMSDYDLPFLSSPWARRAAAGLTGLLLIYGACLSAGRLFTARAPRETALSRGS